MESKELQQSLIKLYELTKNQGALLGATIRQLIQKGFLDIDQLYKEQKKTIELMNLITAAVISSSKAEEHQKIDEEKTITKAVEKLEEFIFNK